MNAVTQVVIASALFVLGIRIFLAPLVDVIAAIACEKSEIED